MSVTLFAIQPTGMGWPDYITAISDPSSIAQAVYFDSVDGVAGTNYPTGTINPPVNNEGAYGIELYWRGRIRTHPNHRLQRAGNRLHV